MPVQIDCNFLVNSTDSDGLGITDLKGPYVQNVFMNTSATPGAGSRNPATPGIAVTNPDPAAGYIVVQLQDQFNKLYSYDYSIDSPASGSALKIDNAALTQGVAYSITTLGDATDADWAAIGVPAGTTPAVGVSFIAASTGLSGNTRTSRVQAAAAEGSGVMSIESLGAPNTMVGPIDIAAQGFGSQLIFVCRHDDGSIAAPAAGSRIRLKLLLSNSSITVQGE